MENQKEILIYSITIRLADCCSISANELKSIIEKELSNYYVDKMETTLPSTGDGTATKLLMEKFIKGKAAQGMTENSISGYIIAIKQLCAYTNKELNMIKADDIEDYINSMRRRGLKDSTVKGYYLKISSIFGFLYDRHLIGDNPCVFIKTPKETVKLKKPLSEQEVERIRMACEGIKDTIKRNRDLALFNFMLDSGARVSEVARIKIGDVDFNEKSIVILGKGNKEREITFTDRTCVRLQEYLHSRNDIEFTKEGMVYNYEAPLFAKIRAPYSSLTKSGIEEEMRILGNMSGVYRLHPHLLRATFATNLAEGGTPINVIAELLGHANLHTINRYVLLTKSKMKELMKRVA